MRNISGEDVSKFAVETIKAACTKIHPGKPRSGFVLALKAGNMLDLPAAQED